MNNKYVISYFIAGVLIISMGTTISFESDFSEGGEPLWIYDSDLYVKHIRSTDLNGDNIEDIIAAEYDSDGYDSPSKVYGIDGSDGSDLWTYSLNDGVRSMTIGDINNDGVMDAVAGASKGSTTPDGKIHAIDGTDGSMIWTFTPGTNGDTNGDVAVGDFNGDQYPDVAVACWDDYVYAINGEDGTELWSTEISSIFINAVDTGDVNGDNVDDVVFAHEYLTGFDNYIGVLDGTDGSEIWTLTVSYAGLDSILSDVDDDGDLEAVFGVEYDNEDVEIQIRDGLTGSLEWDYIIGDAPGLSPNVYLFTYDIDEDTDLDLLVGNEYVGYYIYAFDGDSDTTMWTSEELNGYPRYLSFGDVNDNGFINVVAATYDRVQILNATDGTKDWYYSVGGTIQCTAVGDFNDDGVDDSACSGGADFSGSDPGKSVWALKTIADSPVLWEYDVEEYGNGLALGDFTGDGALDVVAVTSNNKAWGINGETGAFLWSWSGTDNLYTVTTGDFDNDGTIDAAVAGNDDIVTALDGSDGSILWQFSQATDQFYRKCLKSADLDNDDNYDVIAGSDDSNVYAIEGENGDLFWSIDLGGSVKEINIAQMDDQGVLDVVAAATNEIAIIDGSDGQLLWSYSTNVANARHAVPLDANNDGVMDVAYASYTKVVVIDGDTQSELWSEDVSANSDYCLAAGDVNGDSKDDVIVGGGSDDDTVVCLNGLNGNLLWEYTTGGSINCVLTFDIDDNGNLEVVAGSDDQLIYVLGGSNGDNLWDYSTADDVMHIQVGDINGNTDPNIVALTFGFDGIVYAFSSLKGQFPLQSEAGGPYEGIVNQDINFYGQASGGVPPYSWHWQFGDGNHSSQQNPSKSYDNAGDYTAQLLVTDDISETDTDTAPVTVYPELVANANGPYYGEASVPMQFTATATGGKAPYSYNWDFGDGGTSTIQNPYHTYTMAGEYEVTLTVTDSFAIPNEDINITTAYINPQPIEANANGPYEGIVGESIQFYGSATGGVPPYSWNWNFGDGGTSTEKNPTHIYNQAGEFLATLTVTDNERASDEDIAVVEIFEPTQVVADAGGPYEGIEGEPIQFSGSATGGTPPYSYYWDFGDGDSSNQRNPTHIYQTAENYIATLTVTDDNEVSDEDTATVIVNPIGNVIADANGPYTGYLYEEIQFSGSASGGTEPYTYQWNFGDGTTSNEQNPTHAYSEIGTYIAILTVIDSLGSEDSDESTVTIIPDNDNPTIEIIKPTNGIYLNNNKILPFFFTLVIKSIEVEAEASDAESGISYVTFEINGEEKENLTDEPYVWNWNETSFGRKTLRVTSFDKAGNSISDEMTVWKFF